MNRDMQIEFIEYETELIDFFGDNRVELIDILDATTQLIIENKRLIEENEQLENELNNRFEPEQQIDYYEEYGLNENDFH